MLSADALVDRVLRFANNGPMLLTCVAECAARTRSSPGYIPPGHYQICWQAPASAEHRYSRPLRVPEDNSETRYACSIPDYPVGTHTSDVEQLKRSPGRPHAR